MTGAFLGRPSWPSGRVIGSTEVQWLQLDTYLGTFAAAGSPATTIGESDADGWTDITVTGGGTIQDGAVELRYFLYEARDAFRRIVDLSTGLYRLVWVTEIDTPSLDADGLFNFGMAVFQGTESTPTAIDRAFVGGFCPDTSGLTTTASFDNGVANTTSAAANARRCDGVWTPFRDASSPGLGVGTLVWSEADGTMTGTVVTTAVTGSVDRARVWRPCLALGVDSTTTTPVTLRLRCGLVAVSPG